MSHSVKGHAHGFAQNLCSARFTIPKRQFINERHHPFVHKALQLGEISILCGCLRRVRLPNVKSCTRWLSHHADFGNMFADLPNLCRFSIDVIFYEIGNRYLHSYGTYCFRSRKPFINHLPFHRTVLLVFSMLCTETETTATVWPYCNVNMLVHGKANRLYKKQPSFKVNQQHTWHQS